MNAPLSDTQPRPKRKNITGARHWQISENGDLYYQRQARASGGRTIDLGPNALPRVPSAYGDGSRHRFIDEISAYEFHGPPPVPWQYAWVRHLDGDLDNHAADNLLWTPDAEWAEANHRALVAELMRSEIPAAGGHRATGPKGVGIFPFAPYRKVPKLDDCPRWSPVDPSWIGHRRGALA